MDRRDQRSSLYLNYPKKSSGCPFDFFLHFESKFTYTAEMNTRYAKAAVFLVQRCGFTPDDAMEQAAKFDMNGSQLYYLPIDDIKRPLPTSPGCMEVPGPVIPRSAVRGNESKRCVSASDMEE